MQELYGLTLSRQNLVLDRMDFLQRMQITWVNFPLITQNSDGTGTAPAEMDERPRYFSLQIMWVSWLKLIQKPQPQMNTCGLQEWPQSALSPGQASGHQHLSFSSPFGAMICSFSVCNIFLITLPLLQFMYLTIWLVSFILSSLA